MGRKNKRRIHDKNKNVDSTSQVKPAGPAKKQNGPKNVAGKRPQKQYYAMTFKQVKELLETDELSKILLEISLPNGPFELLLKESKLSPETICAILAVLVRICDCPTDNTRILLNRFFVKLLPDSIDSDHFLTEKLQSFIVQLCTKTKDAYPNRHIYLKATHDLLLFVRKLQVTLPRRSQDVIRNMMPPLTAQIDFINKKKDCLKREAIDLLNEINSEMDAKEPEENAEQYADTEKPPSDFRSIDICPSPDDLFSDQYPFIRPNIINGKYAGGVDHYLDVQFRLLREDFIRPLREGIGEYRRQLQINKKSVANKIKDIKIYRNVVTTGSDLKYGDLLFNARFDTSNLRNVQWKVNEIIQLLRFANKFYKNIFIHIYYLVFAVQQTASNGISGLSFIQ